MSALPDRPCMRQLRHQAKDLLKALRVDAPGARVRVEACWAGSRGSPPSQPRLTDALRVIAGEYGFDSWARLKLYVDGLRADDGAAATDGQDGAGAMNEQEFAATDGWKWHIEPMPCDGRKAFVTTTDRAIVHVMPGQMRPDSDGAEPPPLAVYIAQGGGSDATRRDLRPVFDGADGERHAVSSGCGGGGRGGGFRAFQVEPDALALDEVEFVGIEARIETADDSK